MLLVILRGCAVVLCSLVLGGSLGYAQAPGSRSAPEDIAAVLRDADADFVPDRLGDTVRVAGRATVGTGELHTSYLSIFVQDATGGIKLFNTTFGQEVQQGDSVVAEGVVDQFNGLTHLRDVTYRVVPGPKHAPEPIGVALDEVAKEEYEGLLVSGWGQVVDVGQAGAGDYMLLREGGDEGQPIYVFIDRSRVDALDVKSFDVGDVVTIVGVVGQFDQVEPFSGHYQIYPRTTADIEPVGFTQQWMKRAGLFVTLVLLVSLAWLASLRVQVRRRTHELQQSEERFRRFTAATVEGLIFHENGRIVDVNMSLARLMGYREDELIGMDAALLAVPEDRPVIRHAIAQQEEEPYEVRGLRQDGSTFPAEVHGRSMLVDGRHMRVASVRDVTLRHEQKAAIVAARERAEEMVQLKSTLLNNMSHELRTPISAIMGFADLIREEAPTVYAEFAEHIHESGERLLGTLNAVLEVAQLESDTLVPQPHPTCAVEVARGVVDRLAPQAAKKDLTLVLQPPEEPVPLETDPGMLSRVLEHLVDNAIKYTHEGGIGIEVQSEAAAVSVVVRDTGVGISPAFLPHAFDLFRQESNGLSRTYEGAGLGLSIAHRMVELLQGSITVDSTPDEGTVCTVRLPVSMVARVGQAQAA